MKTRLGLSAVLLLLALVVSGCFLAANREINLLVVRTDTGGSEVTVTYRVPPPKPGKTYVLWLTNSDENKVVRVATVEPSQQLRAIKTKMDFWVTGAVISAEDGPTPQQITRPSVLETVASAAPPVATPTK